MASIYICSQSVPTLASHFSCQTTSKSITYKMLQTPSYSTKHKIMAVTTAEPLIVRRSADYPPTLWSSHYIQSLTSEYVGEKYEKISLILKEEVRRMISKEAKVDNPLSTLELVDDMQRLGISYNFKHEISNVLKMVYHNYYETQDKWNKLDLNLKALGFRLLREQGYIIPQEIFRDIMNEARIFNPQICEDIKGMLNLYEASFLVVDNENIMDKANEITRKCLKEKLEKNCLADENMAKLISHALELPLRWRTPRFETIWFIDAYEKRSDMKPKLLEFAKLDFNMVQAIHQEDLKYLSRWWEALSWDKKLTFARDRLVESFMWIAGASYEPQFSDLRRNMTEVFCMINIIDDVHDVYGTLDELEDFFVVMKRWSINSLEELPDYMKICFFGFYNSMNEVAYNILIDKGVFATPYLKKQWSDYCGANLKEAQWYYNKYTPTLEEYLSVACISISAPIMLAHVYFLTSCDVPHKSLQNVVECSSMLLRLADDLGTSTIELKRGDVPKAVECYMHETGVSEEEARAYIMNLIRETWKKLNKEITTIKSLSSDTFVECATNIGRMAQFTYLYGDGFGTPDDLNKSCGISLLFNSKT